MATLNRNREGLEPDPLWYKSGVIYEVHVRAFYDTNGDGTGDFRGLTEKLGYLKELGVTALWLLPFYPSPLKDDGYDIADYCKVHPMYGTLEDFKTFLREAHRHGLRVITELVLNHTSVQHPWFQRARRARPGSNARNFYIWSSTGTGYPEARVIFKDVETSNWAWDSVARAYYWHRFFSHQPDLNYDNPRVHEAMLRVVDFWLDLGVDGLRLDAVPYLYEREGTSCENLPETHAFLKKLRAHVDEKYAERMLLGEANQWPEDAVAYFGQGRGDECQMAYHFPLMPRLFMALRMEDRQPIVDILEQTPPIPETSQWALFLRNHDELTLEMVTDEERDYMYRVYAHVPQARLNLGICRRLAPLVNNDRKRIELLNALLFSLPGTPVLYYGDEIGLGENIFLGDRNGVRTPMQWSSDKNAGFSRANPQSLYLPIILDPAYHYEACNVEVQLANPHSLLWWMRRLLALRKRWRALGEGRCELLPTGNRKILSYTLRYQQETLLVVANLSRFTQPVELDLSAFEHRVPMELFGRTEFPEATGRPYFLSLGPHSFFWFSLEAKSAQAQLESASREPVKTPELAVSERWQEILAEKHPFTSKEVLRDYLGSQPWFCGKSKVIKSLALRESISVPLADGEEAILTFVQVDYAEGDTETYALPLAFAGGAQADWLRQHAPFRIMAELKVAGQEQGGVVYDAVAGAEFCAAMLEAACRHLRLRGTQGEVEVLRTATLRHAAGASELPKPVLPPVELHNTTVTYGDKLSLKLFRRLEAGVNPELEMERFLNARGFSNSPALAGALEYAGPGDSRMTLAVVHSFIPSARSAWSYTLDALGRYYERVITWVTQGRAAAPALSEPLKLLKAELPAEVSETVGTYLESARLLGARTAALHLALASAPEDKDFAPELSTPHYRRAVFQSMRNLAVQNLRELRKLSRTLSAELQEPAQRVADAEPAIIQSYRELCDRHFFAKRMRIHGDCHLGQVLWTGTDFMFIDFEGNAALPLSERRLKHSPLRDVATLLRSFHHAACAALEQQVERGSIAPDNLRPFQSWLQDWNLWVNVACLRAYLGAMSQSGILPEQEEDLLAMLRAHWLDATVNELGGGLKNPTKGLKIPLQGILWLVGEQPRIA